MLLLETQRRQDLLLYTDVPDLITNLVLLSRTLKVELLDFTLVLLLQGSLAEYVLLQSLR